MLALFRPWNRSAANPLKSENTSWTDAFAALLVSLPQNKIKLMDCMQEQWECRLAAEDFSAEYKARQANFNTSHGTSSQADDVLDELASDLDWQLGQLDTDEPVGPGHVVDPSDSDDLTKYTETCAARTQRTTDAVIALASAANFYHVPIPPDDIGRLLKGRMLESHDGMAQDRASAAALLLAEEKAVALQKHAAEGIFYNYQRFSIITNLLHPSD
jgi:hypothetical protein